MNNLPNYQEHTAGNQQRKLPESLEIVGEFLGYEGDEAIWKYFKRHWAAWFPGLGDRTTFLRQAANLGGVKQQLHI